MSRLLLATALALASAAAQSRPEYRIARAAGPITIDAKLDDAAWRLAEPVSDFIFNWYESGEKEPTTAKLLWDDENLYVSWQCKDRHISAYERKRHGPVSKDDCVEIFLSPNAAKVSNYYTFEINALGTMLNRCRTDWWTGPATWEPQGVRYRTTFHGMEKKDESADDAEWIVEMAIPLANFSRDAANTPPRPGDQWRLNLQRLGGKTNAQMSTWSPIAPPSRSFHTPESFGTVIFAAAAQQQGQGRRGGGRGRPPDPAAAAEGREIYHRSCTMCHGLNAGPGDRAPALAGQRRYLRRTEAELYDAIKNGIAGTTMPPSPLPAADVNKIVAYIRSLRAPAAGVAVAGDASKGEAVFRREGCSGCHMINGRGGIAGPDLSNIGAERKLDDLLRALTEPRESVPREFQPVTVTMRNGAKFEGVVKNENNFSLQILGRDGKLHLLLREEAARIDYAEKTLMPTDWNKRLSKGDFDDLVAYLARRAREEGGSR
ncbi:MAG: carbohydrate-binding family 9-like protein [Bryobacteraceae bacterium]